MRENNYSPILKYVKYATPLFTITRTLRRALTSSPQCFTHIKSLGRGNDASQTLFLLFECITSEKKESCVSRTDALLVGTGDQVMDLSLSIVDLGILESLEGFFKKYNIHVRFELV